ncbi:MAG: hypothetical protein PHN42_01850 [Bacilli bacterium]|nr:hypothetical protein [Bacilli bacterium]
MDGELGNVFRPFKLLFIICIIEVLFVFLLSMNLASNYKKDLFTIKFNGISMKCYYQEDFKMAGITVAGSSGNNDIINTNNAIDLEDNMNLDINEYEVYSKGGKLISAGTGWYKNNELTYKEVNNIITLEIKRMDKTIYSGKYITNLNQYINEPGRYYIHIYVNRKLTITRNVKTHISFNVIVGGGNLE